MQRAMIMAAVVALQAVAAQGAVSTTSGDWTDSATWGGSSQGNESFTVSSGHTVTAAGVTYSAATTNSNILGTLNIGTGSAFTGINRLNNSSTTAGGILNLTGGSLAADQIRPGAGGIFTVNINDGGVLKLANGLQGTPAVVTVNINVGGTYETVGTNGTTNLNGGRIVDTNGSASPITSWTGGEYVVNGGSYSSSMINGLLGNVDEDRPGGLANDANNVMNLSSMATKQTFAINNDVLFSATGGTIRFNVYSAATDDNDLMTRAGNGDFILTSDVKLRLDAIGPLSGVSSDYVGAAYKLFNDGDYDDITPTLLPVVWNIGGTDYNVGFNNTLSTDGTLTVSSLQAVPEPASVSALVAAGVLLASRRRRRC